MGHRTLAVFATLLGFVCVMRAAELWELFVYENRSALLVCSRDSEDEAFRQHIEYTDFAIDYVKLYAEGGVLLLPSEH